MALLLRTSVWLLGPDARDDAAEVGRAEVDGGVPGGEVTQGGELLFGGGEAVTTAVLSARESADASLSTTLRVRGVASARRLSG
ncbi:hypothetical protein ACFXPJ_30240 [Streptomyces goshikiensis]